MPKDKVTIALYLLGFGALITGNFLVASGFFLGGAFSLALEKGWMP